MKKSLLLFVTIIFFTNASAQSMSYEELESLIIGMNAQMPLSLGPTMEMTSASMSSEEVKLEVSISDYGGTVGNFSSDSFKTNVVEMLSSADEMKAFCSMLAEMGLSMHYVFYGEVSGKTADVVLTPADLMQICTTETTPYHTLEVFVKQQKSALPLKLNEQVEMTDVYITSSSVIFVCMTDDAMVEALDVELAHDAIADMCSQDMVSLQIVKYCSDAGYALSYIYRGKTSNKEKCVTLTVEEEKDLIRKSYF